MTCLQELDLVPYVFHGVPAPEGSTVSSVYIEARNDLYDRCRVLVVVAGSVSAKRNFGITELPRAVSEGLIGILYRVALPAGPDPIISGIAARRVVTPQDFGVTLDDDLRALLTPR